MGSIGKAIGVYLAAGVATALLLLRNEQRITQQTGQKPLLGSSDPLIFGLEVVFWPAAWYDEAKGQGGLGLLPQRKP